MCPICYLEWRCLVLKDADSLCEKSFSPENDKGTKWETTPQAKGVTSCILKQLKFQKYSIKFKVCMCCILHAHEWSWTYCNHECWFRISNQDKHISIQTVLINPQIKIRAHIYTRTTTIIVCDYLDSIFRLLLGTEDTGHVTIEQCLITYCFQVVFLFFCPFVFLKPSQTNISICIFSVLISMHSLRYRQRQFA